MISAVLRKLVNSCKKPQHLLCDRFSKRTKTLKTVQQTTNEIILHFTKMQTGMCSSATDE